MIIKGKVHKLGNNINTDDIIAAKYLDSQDPLFLGSKCMENINSKFSPGVEKGDIIVAGKNFGCGSSREHAPWAIKGCGIALVIAESFARIFYRNAINVGLPILISQAAKTIKNKDKLVVDLEKGTIKDLDLNKEFSSQAFPLFMQEIVGAGGLIKWLKDKR
ncbi:MAG: 3-isopropylmalate dehydratase small subunit [Candidatus Omnitrophota bacterium]